MQMDQQAIQIKSQEVQQKMELDQSKIQLDAELKQADLMMEEKELALKEREIALKEFEAQKPGPDPSMKIQADMQMAREKMEFEASEADKQRQVELAKAIMSEFNGPEGSLTEPGEAINRAAEIMDRINEVISATRMIGDVPLEETTMMVAEEPMFDEEPMMMAPEEEQMIIVPEEEQMLDETMIVPEEPRLL